MCKYIIYSMISLSDLKIYRREHCSELNNSDDIKTYNNKVKLYVDTLNKKISTCVNMYNTLVKNMFVTVQNTFSDDQSLGTYQSILNGVIENKPLEPISLFLLHIYKNDTYRTNMIEGNDYFFMTEDLKDVTNDNQQKMSALFKLKSYWKVMDDSLKTYIRTSLKTLCRICEQYIENKSNVSDANKLIIA